MIDDHEPENDVYRVYSTALVFYTTEVHGTDLTDAVKQANFMDWTAVREGLLGPTTFAIHATTGVGYSLDSNGKVLCEHPPTHSVEVVHRNLSSSMERIRIALFPDLGLAALQHRTLMNDSEKRSRLQRTDAELCIFELATDRCLAIEEIDKAYFGFEARISRFTATPTKGSCW